jgi:uncharacterized protein
MYLIGSLMLIVVARWLYLYRRATDRRRFVRRETIRTLVGLGFVYLGALAMLLWLENRLLYHPQTAAQWWQPSDDSAVEDVWLYDREGQKVHAWWRPRAESKWTILYCHGNGGNNSAYLRTIQGFGDQLSADVLIVDYPGYGHSEGRPSEAGCYDVADLGMRWLRETKLIPVGRLLIIGESLGGGVATEIAKRHPHRALILLATFTAVDDRAQEMYPFFPTRWLMSNHFRSIDRIREHDRPLYVAHGTNDSVIPHHHGRRLFEAHPGPTKRFFTIDGGDHVQCRTPQMYADLREFLKGLE